MRKIFILSLLATLIYSALALYQTKYDSISDVSKISKLKQEIAREKDLIARLEADWTFLNRPDYLQPLVEKHLKMKPLALAQIGLGNLSTRPAPLPDPLTKMLEAMNSANIEIKTAKIIKAPLDTQKITSPLKTPKLNDAKVQKPLASKPQTLAKTIEPPRLAPKAKPMRSPDLSDFLADLEKGKGKQR